MAFIANESGGLRLRRALLCRAQGIYPFRYLEALVVCFVLLKPISVGQNALAGAIVKVMTLGIFAVLLTRHAVERRRISATLALLVGLRALLLLSTMLGDGDYLNWGYASVSQIALLLYLELESRGRPAQRDRVLRAISDLLIAYLVINYLDIVGDIGPLGMLSGAETRFGGYFLGIRTRVTDCAFPAILVALMCDYNHAGRPGARSAVALALGVGQIVILRVVTGYVGLAVLAAFYLAMTWARPRATNGARSAHGVRAVRGPRLLTMRGATLLGIAVTLLVVVLRAQYLFAGFITGVLGKSVELTGRTVIWDNAFPIIARAPLMGYGVNDSFGAFVPWVGDAPWQAHNQLLQMAHDGGVVSVALLIALMLVAGRPVDRICGHARYRAAFVGVYAALSVMSVSEIFVYNMGMLYLVLFLASTADAFLLRAGGQGDGRGEG